MDTKYYLFILSCLFLAGTRDGRRSYNIETDRRSTYRPQSCFFNNNYNLFDPKSFNSVPVPVCNLSISACPYKNSNDIPAKDSYFYVIPVHK